MSSSAGALGNSDLILPVRRSSHRSNHGPASRAAPTREELLEYVRKIVQFCSARGERAGKWEQDIGPPIQFNAEHTINLSQTLTNLESVWKRIQNGEFLCLWDVKSKKMDIINPEFQSTRVFGQVLDSSLRADPSRGTSLLLPKIVYSNARTDSPSSLTREEFQAAVEAIAKEYQEYHPTLTQIAQGWKEEAEKKYKEVGGRRWTFLKGGESARVRYNLIVAAAYVQNGDNLPTLNFIVNELVTPPENVAPPSGHAFFAQSLARISRRTACRIGYSGPPAHDGGLLFV